MRGSFKNRGTASKPSWSYTVDLPRAVDGKRKQRRRGGFPTRKAAEEALRKFLGHLDRGGDPYGDKTTFAEYATGWAKHHQTQVEPKTWKRYEQLLRLHLLPALGGMRLQQIRAAHVQGCLDGIDRSPRTIRQARAILSVMFKQAVAWGVIPHSPIPATDAPKAARPDLDIPDTEGTKALMAASVGTEWEQAIHLSAYLGTRRGETLAIRWSDVDFDRKRITIARSLERIDGVFRFKDPKSARGRREVPIPSYLVERLRRWKVEQVERKLRAGPAWQEHGLICERLGFPIDPDSLSKGFKRLAHRIGLPNVRLHDLRHSAATEMMARGVHPLAVSKTLGHASEAFTMSVYGHVRDEMLDPVADALEDAYG